jgi:putative ABC transport system permease protein
MFVERRRAVLAVLGVAASLMLVLLLRGIFAGAIERVTYYIRTSPADVFVSQEGVRTMHMSSSVVPPNAVEQLSDVPGVAWAAGIDFTSGSISGPRGRQLSYVLGYDSVTGRGGPARMTAGRDPGEGEVVVDEQAADQLGVGLGDTMTVLGFPLRVVGLSTGGTSITNTTAFVDTRQFERLRGSVHEAHGQGPSYVLVRAEAGVSGDALAERIKDDVPGLTVQTREEFAASEAGVVSDMSADLLRLMSTVGLLIALAVIALGLMSSTLNRIRDFAVLKALGSSTARLVTTVASQVLWTVSLAAATASVLATALSAALSALVPSVQISVTIGSSVQTAVSALLVGLLAALWPLRRVASIDPATAFRESR